MNSTPTTFHKARALASSLRTSRHHGRGWSEHSDRDLARQSHELYVLTQTTVPRLF